MSNQDNLLGFLKKKSLFNQSPQRKVKRSRSKSRDGKDSIIRKMNDREPEEPQNNNNFYQGGITQQPRRETFVPQKTLFQKDYQPQPTFQDNNLRRDNSRPLEPQFGSKAKASDTRLDFTTQDKGNKLVTGLANYAMTFQSARLQSAQCLQILSLKLNTQISNINYRIDQFRTNMSRVLNNQLKALRDQILNLVDQAFKESQRSIREYMKIEEQKLAGEVIKMRDLLEKEYVRVQTMKEEIAQPQWRKVTGEILATELEKNLEELVKKSSTVQIGRWQMKNLSGQRLKKLQVELRDLVRLKE